METVVVGSSSGDSTRSYGRMEFVGLRRRLDAGISAAGDKLPYLADIGDKVGTAVSANWAVLMAYAVASIAQLKAQVMLYKVHQVPTKYREFYIIRGYRSPRCSFKQSLLSMFVATNETVNVWTHLIPFVYYFLKLLEFFEQFDVANHPNTWPFIAYMVTVCSYTLFSTLAHLFCNMSPAIRDICFFFDYGGLSYYSCGSGILYLAYSFPKDLIGSTYEYYFLPVCFLNGVACVFMTCISRVIEGQHPSFQMLAKVFRLISFLGPWLWDNVALMYRILFETMDIASTLYFWMILSSMGIGFFYVNHLPERLCPGKFDIVGQSHQFLHVCAVVATSMQLFAVFSDMKTRPMPAGRADMLNFEFWTYPAFLMLGLSIFTINVIFSWYILRTEKQQEKVHDS